MRSVIGRHRAALAAVVVLGLAGTAVAQDGSLPPQDGQTRGERRLQERMDEAHRREAEVLVRLADDAMAGRAASDFPLGWRNDFLKAQPGTFVPFTVTVDTTGLDAAQALLYVRAVRIPAEQARRGQADERFAFDAIFPVPLSAPPGEPLRVSRGFAVPAGRYDVYVTVRERPADPLASRPGHLKAAVLKQPLDVPDYWTGELATSTIMLADRIEVLPRPLDPDEALERPYVIGQNDVRIAQSSTFRKDRELIVVFVVYNPAVVDRRFDLQVDYHLYRRESPGGAPAGPAPQGASPPRAGERYVTRTDPQRFNPAVLGPKVDPAAGHPVMAGQGILLSSFQDGEYRLEITVTDLLSRKTLSRDVTFTVAGS